MAIILPPLHIVREEIIYAQSCTTLFQDFSSHQQPSAHQTASRGCSNFPRVDHKKRQDFSVNNLFCCLEIENFK